jgi:hypothetical protein
MKHLLKVGHRPGDAINAPFGIPTEKLRFGIEVPVIPFVIRFLRRRFKFNIAERESEIVLIIIGTGFLLKGLPVRRRKGKVEG